MAGYLLVFNTHPLFQLTLSTVTIFFRQQLKVYTLWSNPGEK